MNDKRVRLLFTLPLACLGLLLTAALTVRAQEGAGGSDTILEGTLGVLWADSWQDGTFLALPPRVTLVDAQGKEHVLDFAPDLTAALGGVPGFAGRQVVVRVAPAVVAADTLLETHTVLELLALGPAMEATASAEAVRARWLVLLCRPAEYTRTVLNPQAHYGGLLSSAAPGMDNFWGALSYGAYGVAQSTVEGWYTLPKPWDAYVEPASGAYVINRKVLWPDCTQAADDDVFFPDYSGIIYVVPVAPVGVTKGLRAWYAYGEMAARNILDLDGVRRGYAAVYMPAEIGTYARTGIYVWPQNVLAHEMGHTLGLSHSSGAYGKTYDSGWDVMSGSAWPGYSAACSVDSVYGCVAPHTIAYHKRLMGWLEDEQTVVAAPGTSRFVALATLSNPVAGEALYLKIPRAGSSTRFYTVEARGGGIYEESLPAPAVVLHDVDTTRWDRDAQVVDPDLNGDPNDASAQWQPGETFIDAQNGISLCVEAATGYGYIVGVSNQAGAAPCTLKPHFATTATLDFEPQSGAPGAILHHTLAIRNGGAGVAHNVAVTITLPAEVTLIPSSLRAVNGHVESLAPLVLRVGTVAGAVDGNPQAQLTFDVQVAPSLTTSSTPISTGMITWDGGEARLDSSVEYNDRTPPVTTAGVSGDGDVTIAAGEPITLTLTATDSGAGLLQTLYRVDEGATWAPYTDPLSVQPDVWETMQVMSVDNAGNLEVAHRLTLFADTPTCALYMPLVER